MIKIQPNKFLNLSNLLTIGIKTFCRPKILEFSLNKWINEQCYANIEVIIADDSSDKYKNENILILQKIHQLNKHVNIKLIDLPFDTGLSEGRNQIVELCRTKYIMILDDARTFDSNLDISKIINLLETSNLDLVGGTVNARDSIHSHYSGIFKDIRNIQNTIHIDVHPVSTKIENTFLEEVYETNICLNTFIAKTSSLLKTKWRNELKLGEHETFFYDFYYNKYKYAIAKKINFIQASDELRKYPDDFFDKYRQRQQLFDNNVKLNFMNYQEHENHIKQSSLNFDKSVAFPNLVNADLTQCEIRSDNKNKQSQITTHTKTKPKILYIELLNQPCNYYYDIIHYLEKETILKTAYENIDEEIKLFMPDYIIVGFGITNCGTRKPTLNLRNCAVPVYIILVNIFKPTGSITDQIKDDG